MWSARWPEPQGDLRLEASGEAFWIVHTTKWERTDLAEYRAQRENGQGRTVWVWRMRWHTLGGMGRAEEARTARKVLGIVHIGTPVSRMTG